MTRGTSRAAQDQSILIEGESVLLEPRHIPLSEIRLDPANPRIQHAVKRRAKNGPLTQEELCSLVLEQPGASDLFKTIRDNGGLIEPIYVRPDGRIIEGNCRAASYLRLHNANKNDKRWQAIPAFLVPKISDRQVAVLQGNFHVAGKNKWRAYEKAGHLHTMHATLKMSAKAIANALGMQERVVTRLLDTYKVMSEKVLPRMKGNGLDKWSHIEEFFKNKELEAFRGKSDNIDKFVDLVVTEKVKHGTDVRKLPAILNHSPAAKILHEKGVEKAISVVGRHDPTANSPVFRKVKELTKLLRGLEANELQRLRAEKKAQQLLRELSVAVNDVANTSGFRI